MAKVKTEFWSLSPDKISKLFFYLLIVSLPTQLGKHFWPNFSFAYGLRLDYLSPTIYFTDILILLIFIFSFKTFLTWIKHIPREQLLVFVLFLVSLSLGLASAKNYWAGTYGIVKFLEFSFLAYFVSKKYKLFNKTVLFSCVFVSIFFEALLTFWQYLNQGSIGGIFYFFGERAFNAATPGIANASVNGQLFLRPYATFSHPNVLAGFFVLSILLLLLFSFRNKKLMLTKIVGIVLGTFALLLTLSRTAIFIWITYLVLLFGLWMYKKYKKRKLNPYLLVAIILACLIVVIFIILQNNYILQRFLTTQLSDESVVQRQLLVSQSLNMFWQNPLLGVGINNFYNNINLFKDNVFLIQPVHNIFLLILSETGIIGLCAFLALLLKTFIVVVKKQNKFLLLCLLAIIFLGMFDHYFLTLQQGQLLFTVILSLSLIQ